MPQFSENDINEAKRRVWEMRNRASHFVDDRQEAPPKAEKNSKRRRPSSLNRRSLTAKRRICHRTNPFLLFLLCLCFCQRKGQIIH